MFKLKSKSFVLDLFILLLLILLVKYAHQLLHKPSHTPAPMDEITTINTSSQAETLKQPTLVLPPVSRNRAHLPEKTRDLLATADVLLSKLHNARSVIDADQLMETKDHDRFIADIKEITSHIEHIVQEFEQDPLHGQALLGPVGSSTRIVYERSLQQKLVRYAQETEKIFIRLYNELQGQHKPVDPAASLHVCIAHIKKLSSQLS